MPWYPGNTTVRSAARFQSFLQCIKQHRLEGKLSTPDEHIVFTDALINCGIADPVNFKKGDRSAEATSTARKAPRALASLGFLSFNFPEPYPSSTVRNLAETQYLITPSGHRLLAAQTDAEHFQCFQRALELYQVNNPVTRIRDQGLPKFHLLKFFSNIFLSVNAAGLGPLSVFDIAGVVQFSTPAQSMDDICNKIIINRQKLAKFHSGGLPDLRLPALKETDINVNLKPETLIDYADTTARYLSCTGLFHYYENRIYAKAGREADIMTASQNKSPILDDGEYFSVLWACAE